MSDGKWDNKYKQADFLRIDIKNYCMKNNIDIPIMTGLERSWELRAILESIQNNNKCDVDYKSVDDYLIKEDVVDRLKGKKVRHFKGGEYRVLYLAVHTETKEVMVVYKALYGEHTIYVRPLEMFTSEVDKDKYPNVEQKYRFTILD